MPKYKSTQIKQHTLSRIVCVLVGTYLATQISIPLATFAGTSTPISTHKTFESYDPDIITKAILNSSITSSTSTEYMIYTFEESTSSPLESIETSTTTLTIEAPFIKQWQVTGGITKRLSSNMKDPQVLLVQGALKGLVPSFKPTYITSFYGPKTVEAVKELQRQYSIPPTGIIGPKTRDVLNEKYLNDLCPQRNSVDKKYENLNREKAIEPDYIPPNLVVLPKTIRTSGIICLSSEPARRLEALFKDARKKGIELCIISGYRRPEIQALLQQWYRKNSIPNPDTELDAIGLAEKGHSEHQLGTTVDFSARSLQYKGPSSALENTPEGKWLLHNAHKYGFVMSYPKGKEHITGYIHEPWHFRYMGVDIAKDIYSDNLSIQEYFDIVTPKGTSTLPDLH